MWLGKHYNKRNKNWKNGISRTLWYLLLNGTLAADSQINISFHPASLKK